jgi:signal transduction histidine kinase
MSLEDSTPFRFGWRAVLLDIVFWTVLAVLTTTNRLLDPFPRPGRPAHTIGEIAYWFVDSYLWAALTPGVFWLAWRIGASRRHWIWTAVLLAGVGVAAASFMGIASDLIAQDVFGLRRFGPPRGVRPRGFWMLNVFQPGFLFDYVTYTGVLATGFAWAYFLRYRNRLEESVRLQAHAAHLQAQLAEARLSVLRNQLNPHFLFNTLNAVSALVAKDPKGVRRMIARLSDLLRYSLTGVAEQEIAVEEELKMLGQYLEILEIRYQGRLETHIDAEPGVGNALVPSLILQPLAENAMTHGVGKAGGHGRIEVRAARVGDQLRLSVRDTGPGAGVDDAAELTPGGAGSGMGLRNTRARLTELYGDQHSLALHPTEDGGMVVEILLPFRRMAPERVGAPARESLAGAPHG